MKRELVLYYLKTIGCLLLAGFFISPACATVKLPAVISDHMIIQAETPVTIWGWANAGEKIEISLKNNTVTTIADKRGEWKVKLAPLPASFESLTMQVKGTNTILIHDILIGEVWLCSGQSNMEMELKGSHGMVDNADAEIAAANYPAIRMYLFDELYSIYKLSIPPDEPLKDRNGAWVVCTPETVNRFSALAYFFGRDLQKEINRPVGLINSSIGGTPIEAWTSLPVQLNDPVIKPILAGWKNSVTDYDATKDSLRFATEKEEWLKEKKKATDIGQPVPKAPKAFKNLYVYKPAGLYNALIAPLIPYTIKGILWYQGERNAAGPFTYYYGTQLRTLINDWRKRWGTDFYFIWMQLPRAQKEQTLPSESRGWGVAVRDEMRQTLSEPNTGMAISIDYGGITAGHPTNKQDFAKRMLLPVLHDVYKKSLAYWSGPVYKSATVKGDEIIISFLHADGLKAKAGELKGFAIAGDDKKFVWAKARTEGDKVIVWSEEIKKPVAVRYAWAGNPVTCNLVNGGDLPASPFRTDDWPLNEY